jgi:hypothetical protein
MIRALLLAFIPLFVAVDIVALVAVYLGIGMPLDEAARRRLGNRGSGTLGTTPRFRAAQNPRRAR